MPPPQIAVPDVAWAVLPDIAAEIVGAALGASTLVVAVTVGDHLVWSLPIWATTRKLYNVPWARPEMVVDVAVRVVVATGVVKLVSFLFAV